MGDARAFNNNTIKINQSGERNARATWSMQRVMSGAVAIDVLHPCLRTDSQAQSFHFNNKFHPARDHSFRTLTSFARYSHRIPNSSNSSKIIKYIYTSINKGYPLIIAKNFTFQKLHYSKATKTKKVQITSTSTQALDRKTHSLWSQEINCNILPHYSLFVGIRFFL